jgi:hypothetical protein
MFEQIHAGQWFRYFTGIVESSAALLVLIPRAAVFGLLLWACTMLGASVTVAFLLHQTGEAAFPGLLFLVLAVVCWKRRSAIRKLRAASQLMLNRHKWPISVSRRIICEGAIGGSR